MKKQKKISDVIYKKNEIDANKALTKGCTVSAIIIAVVWVLYLMGLFNVSSHTLMLVNVLFPIEIIVLLSTWIYNKKRLIEKKGFKYFLIIQFILVCFAVNVVVPKHGILLWAACILLVNHYYDPKLSIITFIIVSIMMAIAIYGGMFFGEWDPNLMNGADVVT